MTSCPFLAVLMPPPATTVIGGYAMWQTLALLGCLENVVEI